MLLPLLMNNMMGGGVGPVLVPVPNVVGDTQLQATLDLQADLFAVSVTTAYSSTVVAGLVISQLPLAGSLEVLGSVVTITVSLGPQPVPPTPVTPASRRCRTITAQDIIRGALKHINAYAPGESLSSDDANDALETLNDLLESLSTDHASVYASNEEVFTFTPNKYQYTIGNYCAGTFSGVLTSGVTTITGVTVPPDLMVNGDLIGTGIPAGSYVTAFDATLGTVTMSLAATLTPGTPIQIEYTICGDFKTQRPLRIYNSFTRINTSGTSGLDYPIEVLDREQYTQIGYKGIACPWPIAVWYNPTNPLGTLYFYQNPSGAGELHLFTDIILTNLTNLVDRVDMPQGYVRWLKWALAKELAPEYGKSWTQAMQNNWKEARDYVKALNQVPTPVSNYDQILTNPRYDAGWILYGGFR